MLLLFLRCDEAFHDFESDPDWLQIELQVGFLNSSGVETQLLKWDPHFVSAIHATLSFCASLGDCDMGSKAAIHSELVARLQEASKVARVELRDHVSGEPRAEGWLKHADGGLLN